MLAQRAVCSSSVLSFHWERKSVISCRFEFQSCIRGHTTGKFAVGVYEDATLVGTVCEVQRKNNIPRYWLKAVFWRSFHDFIFVGFPYLQNSRSPTKISAIRVIIMLIPKTVL